MRKTTIEFNPAGAFGSAFFPRRAVSVCSSFEFHRQQLKEDLSIFYRMISRTYTRIDPHLTTDLYPFFTSPYSISISKHQISNWRLLICANL